MFIQEITTNIILHTSNPTTVGISITKAFFSTLLPLYEKTNCGSFSVNLMDWCLGLVRWCLYGG